MPITGDFSTLSKPAQVFHQKEGQFAWPVGQTFQVALGNALPTVLKNRTLPVNAEVTILITVRQT